MLIRSIDSSYRHWLMLLIFLIMNQVSMSQISIEEIRHIEPKTDYSNVHSIRLHDDRDMTASIIFIKKAVRKHMHQFHTETVIVLKGRAAFFLNGEESMIKKGDQIIIPKGTPHAVIVKSKKPLMVLSIQSPQFKGLDRIFLD